MSQLDDENVPVENNVFDSSPAHELVEELSQKANFFVARKLMAAMPDKAFLRRQTPPNSRRLHHFVERMNRLGYGMDATSSGTLQSTLSKVSDVEVRKVSHCPLPFFFLHVSILSVLTPDTIGHGSSPGQGHAAREILRGKHSL